MSEKGRNEKGEKDNNESWDEKWRRDPVEAVVWALILIWAGLVWLASSMNILPSGMPGDGFNVWAIGFLGAGAIILLGVVFRVLVPAYRRPLTGSIILGIVFMGIGLGQMINWVAVGALVLIAIGVSILVGGFLRRE
jgi:hypothetical protein